MEFQRGDLVESKDGKGVVSGVDSKGVTVLFIGFRLWFVNGDGLTLLERPKDWVCHDF